MKTRLTTLILTLLAALTLRAAEAPKHPGPEHKKLEMGVGRWKMESVNYQSPFGRAGRSTGVGVSRMILGGWFVQNDWKNTEPDGVTSVHEIISWDPEKSHYQSSWFTSNGSFPRCGKDDPATCTIDGRTWNWTWTEEKDGKTYQCREVGTFAADGKSFTVVGTYSADGKTWEKRYEGKARKVGK